MLPREFTADAYRYVLSGASSVVRAYGVTIFVTAAGTFIHLLTTAMLAYALTRKEVSARNKISLFVFFPVLFSGGLVPYYILLVRTLHLKDTIWALIAAGVVSPMNVIIMKNFFKSIPESLIESARIDGSSEYRTLFQIVLPLSKPSLATIGLLTAISYWNNWMQCSLFIETPKLYTGAPGNDVPPAQTNNDAQSGDSGSAGSDREFVELSFYIMNSPTNEQERVMEKANAIIQDKINAKLNLVFVDPGTYAEKINLMIGSGEEFDLCFMANWGDMNFFENAAKGAFVDMTDLLAQYAPQTYSRIPEALWDGVKVDGKIYGSVNYQQWGVATRKGYQVRMDVAEEVGFDWKELKGKPALEALETLTPFLEKAVAAHPEMIGWETSSTYSFFLNDPLYWDMEPVGDMTQPGWIRFTEPDTVINQFATPEFAAYCDIMRDWYQKGLVRKDGATLQDTSPDRQACRILAQWDYNWPDPIDNPPTGVEDLTIKGYNDAGYSIPGMSMVPTGGGAPRANVSATRTVIPAAAGPTACVAISATSKNPERAMELIELLNTNDELFNLIAYGEEGVDYEYNAEGNWTPIEGMYNFSYNEWQIGQSYSPDFARSATLGRNQAGDDQRNSLQIVYQADREADPSPVTGFTFNPDSVKTEIANCSAVISEMIPVLSNGAADPAELLPQFLSRLENAGIDNIIAEKQTQLDAWKAANGN